MRSLQVQKKKEYNLESLLLYGDKRCDDGRGPPEKENLPKQLICLGYVVIDTSEKMTPARLMTARRP